MSTETARRDRTVEIAIRAGVGPDVYTVSLIVEDGPEFPPGRLELDWKRLESVIADPQKYGRILGEMLFADDVIGKQFRETLAVAESQSETTRVLLRLEEPALERVHWERIFYPLGSQWFPLGASGDASFSRWIGKDNWRRLRAVVRQPIRVLAVVSSGEDFDGEVEPISPQERALLRQTLSSLPHAIVTFLESDTDTPPTVRRLRSELQRGYHIVHFCCHGKVGKNGSGELLLETDDGGDPWLKGDQLVESIVASTKPPRLCFFSACESAKRLERSSFAPIGVQVASQGPVAAVVAMTDSVALRTAYDFAAVFYTQLLEHGSADRAMNEARESVRDKMDWGVPVLFLSARDGVVLKRLATRHDELTISSLNDRVNLLLDRHSLFAGRDEFLDAMNQHLVENHSGYLFITGPSGIGKTALLANWVNSLRASSADLICYHFMSESDDLADEDYTIRNLCEQLRVFHHLRRELPLKTSELRGWYRRVLMKGKAERGKRMVVVLDGLDEAKGWKPGPDMFPPILPEGVFVVLSARATGQNWAELLGLSASNVKVLELRPFGASEISNLLRSAGKRGATLAKDRTFLTATLQRSEGDPLYLHFLVMDILAGRISSLEHLAKWPVGLDGYLKQWWDALTKLSYTDRVTNLIGYLLVAKGRMRKLDLVQLQNGQALDPVSLDKVVQESRRFLVGNDEEGYSLGHHRFREYIAREHIPAIIQQRYRTHLLKFCSLWKDNYSTYAILHYPDHLSDEASTTDQLQGLLADFEYLQARVKVSDVTSLISAYDALPAGDELRSVQAALALSGAVLTKDKAQLASHLLGRLLDKQQDLIQSLLVGARKWRAKCWLRPLTQSITSSTPLLRTLTGHSEPVLKVVLLDSQRRRVISISQDRTLRVWHVETGGIVKTLISEDALMKGIVALDSRRVVCASSDTTG